MRLEELAARLTILDAKVNYLTTGVYNVIPVTNGLSELDARLTVLETTVDALVSQKTNEVMTSVAIADSSDNITSNVETIVALSPSATFPDAAEIVTAIVQSQVESPAIESEAVAGAVATAITAIITAQPEVVVEASEITEAIITSLNDYQAVWNESEFDNAVDSIATIINEITGEETTDEIKDQIAVAIGSQPDAILDAIEARLNIVEAKYSTLVSK
jgi:hypothetical protein